MITNTHTIDKMRNDGYPYKIIGNGGYTGILAGYQPLTNGDYVAIYRYPGGVCCHDIDEIRKYFDIIEQ